MEDKSQMQDSHPSQVQQHQSYSDSKANESSATNKSASILNAIQKRRNNSIEGIDSLNLLKDNLQYYFNQKIQNVMNEFVSTYFDPAIKNIEKYTDETITGEQINNLLTDLLYSVKYKYPSKPLASCSLLQDNAIVQIKDDKTNLSLLHQALKRKRSDSETEQLFKRQFFLSSAPKSTPTSTRQIFHIIQAPEKKDSC